MAGTEDIFVAPARPEALKVSSCMGYRGLFPKSAAGA